MDLSERLRKIEELRRRMAAAAQSRARRPELTGSGDLPRVADAPDDPGPFPAPGEAEVVTTSSGSFLRVVREFPIGEYRGSEPFAAALAVNPDRVALLARDPVLGDFDPRSACFLDIETTSLSGGAGNLIFLLGLGSFADERFVVEQLLLRTPADEAAMLGHLCERAASFESAVTFFGKNFDRVRIEDKLAYFRLASTLPWNRHLDLCHVARRLFGGALDSCRLTSLEHALLGVIREGDLPGEECPQAFFDFIRGVPSRIRAVLQHNLEDILTLPSLLAHVNRAAGEPETALLRLKVGRLFLESGDEPDRERGRRLLEEATEIEAGRASSVGIEAGLLLAQDRRRRGRDDEAALVLEALVKLRPADPRPFVELSKHREHRLRDHPGALALAKAALDRACGTGPCGDVALRRRIERLERKGGT